MLLLSYHPNWKFNDTQTQRGHLIVFKDTDHFSFLYVRTFYIQLNGQQHKHVKHTDWLFVTLPTAAVNSYNMYTQWSVRLSVGYI